MKNKHNRSAFRAVLQYIRSISGRTGSACAGISTNAVIKLCFAFILLLQADPYNVMAQSQPEFNFETVVRKAREAAAKPYDQAKKNLPDFLQKMNYDQWRDIRFVKDRALWNADNLNFTVEFFHPGFLYDMPVTVNQVENGNIIPVKYSKELFSYGKNEFTKKIPENTGFAGFRIHYPLMRKDYHDEATVFLGASYFRAVAKDQVYGLSARGLAVDTAVETGEEFPYFKEFWIVKPEAGAYRITVYALLNSVSLTGAYRFDIHPGKETTANVTLRLFPRKAAGKIGLAPLTSMFFYSQLSNKRPVDDFRPEIHDSDGLLLAYPDGEYVWRPLVNPERLFINSFRMQNPAGFGLLQRDTVFDHYQDLEAYYEKRPSVWMEPEGTWGPGRVELIQIPTDSEKNDNIVAYWIPDKPIEKTGSETFKYKLTWYTAGQNKQHPNATVISSRSSAGKDENHRKFIIDFKGGALDKLPSKLPADSPLEAIITLDKNSGKDEAMVTEKQLYQHPDGGWRLVFQVRRKPDSTLEKILPNKNANSAVEIRAYLKQGEKILTEIWSHAFI